MGGFLGPFHYRRRHPDEIARQKRVRHRVAGILLSGGHDKGCAGHAGVPQATEVVVEPARCLKIHESCAARGLCVTVGNRDNTPFLKGPDIVNVWENRPERR